jgi:hypothetical protein
MRKSLHLRKQTVRLLTHSVASVRGGLQPADDGTNSGYPPCLTFYCGGTTKSSGDPGEVCGPI